MAGLARAWRRSTGAPPTVTDAERAHQIRLLTGMLLLMIPLGIVSISIQLALVPDFGPSFVAIALALACLVAAYGLARAGHYRSGAVLAVGVTAVGCFAIILLRPHVEFGYAFLFLSLFLASLLFNKTGAVITTLLLLLVVTLILPALGIRPPADEPAAVPIFLVVVSALLQLHRWHRHGLEHERYAELAASEERFRALSEVSFEGIVVAQEGCIIDINQRGAAILGAPRNRIGGRSVLDFCAPECQESVLQHMRAGSEQVYEGIGQRADGTRFPLELHGRQTTYLGQPVRVTVFRDLTERRRTEDALLQIARGVSTSIGESFFHSLVAHLAKALEADYAFVGELLPGSSDRIGTIAVNTKGQPVANFEYSLAGTPCEKIMELQPCSFPHGVQALFPSDPRLAALDIEAYVGAPLFDSSRQPLGLIAVLFRRPVEQHERIASTLQIFAARATAELQRVHAEAALRASEARYRTIVETAQEGIWQIDADGRTTFVNQKMADMLGYTPEEMLGRTMPAFMHEDDEAKPAHDNEHRHQGSATQHDFKFRRKDGSLVCTLYNTVPLTDEHGQYAGAFAMVTDITQRRQTEQRILQLNRLLRTTAEINQLMAHERTRQRLLDEACRVLVEHGEYRMAWIGLAHYSNGTVEPVASAGFEQGYLEDTEIRCDDTPLGQGPTGTAIRAGRPVINQDTEQNSSFAPWREMARSHGYSSSAAFPLRLAGQIIGAVSVYSEKPGAFNPDEVALLEDLVEDIGYALQGQEEMEARKRAEKALAESEANFRALTENANVGILVNHQGKHVFANTRLLQMLDYTLEELRTTGIKELVHPDDYDHVMSRFRERMDGRPVTPVYETRFLSRQGREVPVEVSAAKTTWQGEPAGLVFLLDISERRRTEAQMHKLSSAIEQTADAVTITDRSGIIEYVNPAFEHMTGYTRAEAIGKTPRLVKSDKQGAPFHEQLWQTILAGQVFSEVFINRHKNGNLYYEEKTITPLKDDDGRVTHFVATGKDVTERMQTQERLQYMAQHDALTELPNRVLLLDRLKQALARARWHERIVALLFIDLDRFKTINDTLGHETGDLLLQQLATRFSSSVRSGDTVARFGGDEFVILLDDVANENDIRSIALKVLSALVPAFQIDDQNLYITASIGISLYPNDGEDSTTLLKHADIAMYRAKELGKNTYQFYSADMSARAFERLTLESSLRHALERNELRLHYQPVFDVESGGIISVEALLRWQHPDFGLVLPNDFIPLLEETGLIVQAGEWVLDTACAQLRAWHQAGWPQLRLAVNLSPRQFQAEGHLTNTLERNLKALCCNPHLLELEITEGLLLQHAASTLAILDRMQTMGLRLAIDDFGTGYSSLGYLRRFPIDSLKIDRSFVHDIPEDEDDSAITTAIIVLAQSLKLDVIAEGVETEAQRDFLRARGCHMMQGLLFSRPLPAEEITTLLEAQTQGLGRDKKKLY
jgi:diguanylate cyclase (GGDEF)-like protein/PAS domain S-box-containing protein